MNDNLGFSKKRVRYILKDGSFLTTSSTEDEYTLVTLHQSLLNSNESFTVSDAVELGDRTLFTIHPREIIGILILIDDDV